jgi:hypothetical protein
MARCGRSSLNGVRIAASSCTWEAQHEAAGLARDALYLPRPDTYVAVADVSGVPEAVAQPAQLTHCGSSGPNVGTTGQRCYRPSIML